MTSTHCFPDTASLSAWMRDFTSGTHTIVAGSPRKPPPAPSAQPAFAPLSDLKSIIEYEKPDQVISVECGISYGALQTELARNRHWLPVIADSGQSLLDLLTASDGGELEHGFGGPRDLVLGLSIMLADGSIIKSGGKVVKNVTGYDTTKLFVGSRGFFGIPILAHLRLYALPEVARTLVFAFPALQAAFAVCQAILKMGLPVSCCELYSASRLRQKGLAPQAVPEGEVYLALLIHGHHRVADEIAASAKEVVSGFPDLKGEVESTVETAPADAENAAGQLGSIWRCGSYIDRSDEQEIVVTLPLTYMRQLLQDRQLLSSAWQARPWRGCLRFHCPSSEVAAIVILLKAAISRMKIASTIIYPSETHWLMVDRIPEQDTISDLIKDELKKRFDPQSKLNRLVRL